MPQMADIVVKAADGTTNVTYSAKNPSSGDGVSALWRADSVSTTPAAKPSFQMRSVWNGPRTARRVEVEYDYPQSATNTTTSLVSVVNHTPFKAAFTIPLGVPDDIAAEAVAQMTNLMAATLVRDSLKTGFAPT